MSTAFSATPALPTRLSWLGERTQITVGMSNAAVWRVESGEETLFLKAEACHPLGELPGEVERLRSDSVVARRERAARTRLEREIQAVQAERDALKTKLAETEKQLADSQAQQRATAQTLAQIESAKKQSESQLTGIRQDLQQCRTHNIKLYGLGREMMDKYRDKTCQDALAQAEPFTGLKKVEVENLLETWRDQLDREKLDASKRP